MAKYYADPLGFVLMAYPWGEKGRPLENEEGPDANQRQFLIDLGAEVKARGFRGTDPVMPILMSVSSGHGTGKSVMGAWIADWILSTRPHSIGTVTANTFKQLESRTWAAIRLLDQAMHHGTLVRHPEDRHLFESRARKTGKWSCRPAGRKTPSPSPDSTPRTPPPGTCSTKRPTSRTPSGMWPSAASPTASPCFSPGDNPPGPTADFTKSAFGSQRNRWNHRTIDSRKSRFTNKELIEQWRVDYGEDSDFFRVRVLGIPPRASDLQYIDSDRIFAAQHREAFHFDDEPLVVGLDVARGGKANTVFRFRRGMDARSIPPIRISGEQSRDSMVLVTKLLQIMNTKYGGVKPAMAFVDSGFGGPIVDRCRQLGYTNVIEVRFGAACPDPVHYANMRAWMWSQVRDFLQHGAIDQDTRLATDLAGPSVKMDRQDRICLESKEEMEKRGLDSPDDGDALALTFAQPVLPPEEEPLDEDEFESVCRYQAGGWMR